MAAPGANSLTGSVWGERASLWLEIANSIHYGCVMATITLKNIPAPLHEALKRRALSHRRSLNSEAIECLERVLLGKPMDVPAYLTQVRSLRAATPGQLSEDLIREARETGRP
jgi:plasmid stability protein